jgi:hypothetical protein
VRQSKYCYILQIYLETSSGSTDYLVPAHNLGFSYLILAIFKPSDLTKWMAFIISKRSKISLVCHVGP